MRLRLLNLFDAIGSSYWFIPSLMALGAFLLSLVTLMLDGRLGAELLSRLPFVYLSQPAGARAFLSTVAGSMLGVAGVTFSILMVVLPMASGQFGPRLLSNFMRDRGIQTVLGAFIATFVYCLLVLRTVRGESSTLEADAFVPQLSLAVALLLTAFNLGMFIYFIHHTAESIQVAHLLERVNHKLRERILHDFPEPVFPASLGLGPQDAQAIPALPRDFKASRRPLLAKRGSYLRTIDEDELMRWAEDENLLVELRCQPGDFVMQDAALAYVYPGLKLERLEDELRRCFAFGPSRTPTQDLVFLFEQFLEVALRALSPGINDPITAMRCTDRITDNLSLLARRERPSPYRYGESGRLRLIAPRLEPCDLVPHLFGPIRNYGKEDFMTLSYLLKKLSSMGDLVSDESFRRALQTEAERVREQAEGGLAKTDYARLVEHYEAALERLGA